MLELSFMPLSQVALLACLVGSFALGVAAVFSMCPLMLASFVSMRRAGADVDRVVASGAYHSGRIGGNVVMTTVFGLFGWMLFAPESPVSHLSRIHYLPEWLLALSGTSMIVAGITIFARPNIGAMPVPGPGTWLVRSPSFARAISYATHQRSPWLLGLLVGIMPCVPLLPVLATSVAMGTPLMGAILGLGFGAGTLVALLARGRVASANESGHMTPLATGPLAFATIVVTVVGAFIVVAAAIATMR
ncbi:MAG: sulfite exporter TauE/SafE family protein [Coriobacteriia bacterium]|nr:sulfite exporter TauE/SafE family protein [Coriobacteriia bacterium]